MLKLARRWDDSDRLRLYRAAEVPTMRRSPVTAVVKNEQWDRLILDRRGPNGEEARLKRASQTLALGWVLCDLVLKDDEELKVFDVLQLRRRPGPWSHELLADGGGAR